MESPSQHSRGELAAKTAAAASISLDTRELASPTTDATKQRIAAENNKNGGASRGSSASSVSSAGDSDGESGCEKNTVDRTDGTGKETGSRYPIVSTAVTAGASGLLSVGCKEQRSPSGNHLRPAEAFDHTGSTTGERRRRRTRSRSRSARSPIQLAASFGSASEAATEASASGLHADRGGGSRSVSSSGVASTIVGTHSPTSAYQRRSSKKGFSEPSSASVSQHGSIRRMAIGRTFSVPEKSAGSQRGSGTAAYAAAPMAASRRHSAAKSLVPSGIAHGGGGAGRTNDSSEEDLVKAGAAAIAAAGVALRAALGVDDGNDSRSPRESGSAAERLAIAAGGQRSSPSRELTPLNKATLQAVEKTVEAIDDLRGRPEHDIDRYVDSNLEDATLSVVRHCLKAVLSMDVDQSNFQMYAALAEASKKRRKRRSESKRRAAAAAAAVAAAYAPGASRPGARQSVPSHVVAPRRRLAEPAAGKLSSSAGPPPRVHPKAKPEAGYEWALHRVGCPQDIANYYYYRHSTKPRYKWVQVRIRRPVAPPPYNWAAEAGYKPFREREVWKYNDRRHFPPYCYPMFNSLRHPFSKADSPPKAKIAPLVELPRGGRRPPAVAPAGIRASSRTARVARG